MRAWRDTATETTAAAIGERRAVAVLSRSPYEPIKPGSFTVELGGRPPETIGPFFTGGCGDANYTTCREPEDMSSGRAGVPDRYPAKTVTRDETYRRLNVKMRKDFAEEFNKQLYNILFFDAPDLPLDAPKAEQPARPGRDEAAIREERALRPSIAQWLLKAEHRFGWGDVVGNAAAREALREAIEEPVRHAALFAYYGRRAPRGVLLYGPPGCGKTLFGKAAAGMLAALYGKTEGGNLILLKGPEIQSPLVGVTEAAIRAIFTYARAFRKRYGRALVVFIDEADALLPSRTGTGGRRAAPWEEGQVATFLAEMDGLEENGAFVILASNRPEAIAGVRDQNTGLHHGFALADYAEREGLKAARIVPAPRLHAPLYALDDAGAVVRVR